MYCSVSWVLHQEVQTMTFSWLMKYFKKQKWRKRSGLRRYELEKNIRNHVGKCKSMSKKK